MSSASGAAHREQLEVRLVWLHGLPEHKLPGRQRQRIDALRIEKIDIDGFRDDAQNRLCHASRLEHLLRRRTLAESSSGLRHWLQAADMTGTC